MSAIVVYCTTDTLKQARSLSDALVKDKLAACVSVVPLIHSTYWWKGKIERATESLLIIKTKSEKFPALAKRIKALHSYTVPEILALPVIRGNPDYLKWLQDSVSSK